MRCLFTHFVNTPIYIFSGGIIALIPSIYLEPHLYIGDCIAIPLHHHYDSKTGGAALQTVGGDGTWAISAVPGKIKQTTGRPILNDVAISAMELWLFYSNEKNNRMLNLCPSSRTYGRCERP
jgi:hypothetical protein